MTDINFVTWEVLKNPAGCMIAVLAITQLVKTIKGISALPTQLLSYGIAVLILELATLFTDGLNLPAAVLVLFNAAIVSLAANGGYMALRQIGEKTNGKR